MRSSDDSIIGRQATVLGSSNGRIARFERVDAGSNPALRTNRPCLQASATNTAITATLPALGTGNTNATVNIQGFYQ